MVDATWCSASAGDGHRGNNSKAHVERSFILHHAYYATLNNNNIQLTPTITRYRRPNDEPTHLDYIKVYVSGLCLQVAI